MDVPLIGRTAELERLRAARTAAAAGSGRLVLVSGDPGIGKSRLAAAVAAESTVPVARGYAVDDPGMPPLWPWLRVARDVPGLADVLRPGDSATAQFTMFADACDVLAAAGPLVIVLEDLHWADQTSLRLLSHLAGEISRTRLLVVGTFREATGPLAGLLRSSESIRLTGLSRTDIAVWLRTQEPGVDVDTVASRLSASTNGNPLFVRILMERKAFDDPSAHPELRRLVLDRLPHEARGVLGAASVLGEEIDPPLLQAVALESDVDAMLDLAVRAGVLRSVPETATLAFTHALVRDAVYSELPPSQRVVLHRRAAEALEKADHCAAGRIAYHWRAAGEPVHCVRWARQAAKAAIEALAYDEAVKFAQLALDNAVDSQAELTLELARAEFVAGAIGPCLEHSLEAARLGAGRPEIVAGAALVSRGVGDVKTVAAVDRLCASALRLPQPDAVRAQLLAKRAIAAVDTGANLRAQELSASALELAEASGDPDALMDGIHARHFTLCAPQFLAERMALAYRACELAEQARQPLAALWGHLWLTDAAFQRGDLSEVDHQLGQIEQFASARGHLLARWHLIRARAARAALVGEIPQALAHNQEARGIALRLGSGDAAGLGYAFLNQISIMRGAIDRATGEAALALLRGMPELVLVRVFIPLTHAMLGETEQAVATFEEFRHMPETLQIGPRWAPTVFHIGLIATMLGDVETAERVYRCFSALEPDYGCDGSGPLFCAGSTARILGELAFTCGRLDAAVAHFETAIRMNAAISARPYLAVSRLGLAKTLVAQGESLARAKELLTGAAAEFRLLDLPGQLAAADALLAKISTAARNSNPLSRRETEVAELIAQALSNKQIAERLVLSERTVESHVSNILTKLGAANRMEIASWSQGALGGGQGR
ncbi:AAA family ATPase [Actinocrispum sp. NPDC049592]|uniref:ATP-binding protein n=1 Tax=Actinocrispum sp. NPDC049592 TaxID=3154835 RepID=UPI0034460E4F